MLKKKDDSLVHPGRDSITTEASGKAKTGRAHWKIADEVPNKAD